MAGRRRQVKGTTSQSMFVEFIALRILQTFTIFFFLHNFQFHFRENLFIKIEFNSMDGKRRFFFVFYVSQLARPATSNNRKTTTHNIIKCECVFYIEEKSQTWRMDFK